MRGWTLFIGSGQDPIEGFCGQGNEPSGFIKGGMFLDRLQLFRLLLIIFLDISAVSKGNICA